MKRREFLTGGLLSATLAASAGVAGAQPASDAGEKIGFLFIHGSWHGAWCWELVEPFLNAAGYLTSAIDLPGHGLNARFPRSFLARPLDRQAFATERSPLADIGVDAYADAVIAGARNLADAGADRVISVGHSMGGVPITFAAAKEPHLFDHLIYVTAIALSPGKSGFDYLSIANPRPEPAAITQSAFLADPAQVGALRIDPRSMDTDYLSAFKARLAADVEDERLAAVMHMLTPDAPFSFYANMAEFPEAYGAIRRSFIRCTQDWAVHPAMADGMIADMNAAWPQSPLDVIDIDASHEVMFSRPDALAQALMAVV